MKRVNPPSLPFSDIIRTRSPLSFSSTGTLVPHLNANKSEKGIMNYIHEIDSWFYCKYDHMIVRSSAESIRISRTNCLHYTALQIYKASESL